ncbi:hypothetical protein QTL97_11460 [Sporosarcina thermotolerans]|uniref:Peptidase C39-like domain-containing protein n=1 Tax=Sporosarcina thermotolerans TaxID=633404 RepID=A0AAW9A7H5_9BACL|nr:C39 family peptidase [Sporosarcina thermotolerans]MDW0117556.1 hypothetical protein [Sporosarcina thermotolerans]WHT49716.1 hypothetical protein QNH10_09610 [Sporosarcina thermotolerans]
MSSIKGFQGKSQYDNDIDVRFRPSACGPVTAYTILRYHKNETTNDSIDHLYRLLGGTKIGLFKWRFVRRLRKLLGPEWIVVDCGIEGLKKEIDEGRPVAAKFDKWFSFHWFGKFVFDYHWVPVIGFKETANGIMLIVHDNGGRNRDSRVREIAYESHKDILSFVKIEKTTVA